MKVQVEGESDPAGEYVGMLSLDRSAAGRFRELLEAWDADGRDPNGWYETVIRDGLLAEVTCRPVQVGGAPWVEIDDPADLARGATVGS
jgi:choline kinase